MKNIILLIISGLLIITTGCQKDLYKHETPACSGTAVPNNLAHPMKDSVNAIMSRYIAKGIPGIQVAIKNNDGWYLTAQGYAALESKTPLQPCTPGWLFSLTKAYTASLVMKQKERSLIDLDATIDHYLPANIAGRIRGSNQVTVRMLLNHSSGMINFTELPAYMLWQFNNPLEQPSLAEMLEMVYDKELRSQPGTSYFYSNTNYLLLHFILEKVTGKTYKELLSTEIFQPLHLNHTYYDVPSSLYTQFPNYYFDRYANEQLENVSLWNHHLANASYSWGGIASTPSDAILFYEALMQGRVVSMQSLAEMTDWFHDQGSSEPVYGLGIEYWQFMPGSTPQRGHEGDGIGNSTMLLYIPDNDTYIYINCTAGRKLFGPYLFKITDFKNELAACIAKWR
ncbi:MAG TPA: serine hydrolase domain-containing protein [Chitinophagaceae bacterium]